MSASEFEILVQNLRNEAAVWFNNVRIRELETLIREAERARAVEEKLLLEDQAHE